MGKLTSADYLLRTSPPPIEKRVSWGSCWAPASPPPIEKRVSWGSWWASADYHPPNVPTTYREECLVGKLTRADNFPTTYTDEGLVGKLS